MISCVDCGRSKSCNSWGAFFVSHTHFYSNHCCRRGWLFECYPPDPLKTLIAVPSTRPLCSHAIPTTPHAPGSPVSSTFCSRPGSSLKVSSLPLNGLRIRNIRFGVGITQNT